MKKVPLESVKPIYLLAAASVCCVVALAALRSNNMHMVQLRNQVYIADKNNGNVSAALTELQRYVTAHMNTDLTPGNNKIYPPIQLKYTYERLQAASAVNASNEQVYIDAQKYCEGQNGHDFSGRNRVPCIQDYVKSHGASVPQPVPDSMYKFDFLSPAWSPDLAGWMVVSTAVFLLLSVVFFSVQQTARHRLKRRKK